MKIRLTIILAAVVISFVVTSCSHHKTCATYLKNTKEVKQERF